MIVTMSLSEPEFQAWNVSERQFPRDGTKSEQLKFLLNYAILAPSSHNTQPWLFKIVGDNTIELYADRTRGLPLVDPVYSKDGEKILQINFEEPPLKGLIWKS